MRLLAAVPGMLAMAWRRSFHGADDEGGGMRIGPADRTRRYGKRYTSTTGVGMAGPYHFCRSSRQLGPPMAYLRQIAGRSS